jgi:mannose-P-dolichol utilization defect protein 1
MSNPIVAQVTKVLGLSETCQAALSTFDFQPDCTKMLVSKVLGLGVIGGSFLYKLPQILKILGSGSVAGLSYPSIALELIGFTISLVYNIRNEFPFSTYGEYIFMIAQST